MAPLRLLHFGGTAPRHGFDAGEEHPLGLAILTMLIPFPLYILAITRSFFHDATLADDAQLDELWFWTMPVVAMLYIGGELMPAMGLTVAPVFRAVARLFWLLAYTLRPLSCLKSIKICQRN